MADREFQDGEVVQLKSGGLLMTIEGFEEASKRYACVWFEKAKVMRDSFPGAVLTKYEPEDYSEIISSVE